MGFKRKDHFHKKAKDEGYRSRAVYKLQEIQRRFRVMRQGGRVLDLGAAPGGWLQVAAKLVGKRGKVVGVDLLPIEPLPCSQVHIIEGDMRESEIQAEAIDLLGGTAQLVMSDMAPNITGIRVTDCARSFDLASLALETACQCLEVGGSFIVKIFPGDDMDTFLSMCKQSFRKVRTTKPEATRKTSSELYVIGLDYRGKRTEDAA